jgi:hypothetical protein
VYVDVPKAQQQAEGEAIPFDDAHKHFGKGQTEADLELAPVSDARCVHTCARVSRRELLLPLARLRCAPLLPGNERLCAATPARRSARCRCTPTPQGKHTLTLQFADALHQSYGPKWASAITVNVK